MTKTEKIALLNTIHNKVVHWDNDYGNIVFDITIALDDEAQHVLNQLGIDDQYIERNKYENPEGDLLLNITDIGFKVVGAQYWHSEHGFNDD